MLQASSSFLQQYRIIKVFRKFIINYSLFKNCTISWLAIFLLLTVKFLWFQKKKEKKT